jgi:hypothetical protein
VDGWCHGSGGGSDSREGSIVLNEQSRYREMTIAMLGKIIFFPTTRLPLKIASVPTAVARLLVDFHAGSACDTAVHQE